MAPHSADAVGDEWQIKIGGVAMMKLTDEQIAWLKAPGPVAYDPRDAEQRLDDPGTWKTTNNGALLLGRLWFEQCGLVDWQAIAREADNCDFLVPIMDQNRTVDSFRVTPPWPFGEASITIDADGNIVAIRGPGERA